MISGLAAAIVLIAIFLFMAIKVLREYERAVVFRLGRVIGRKGPGLILLIPIIDRMVRVSLRTVAMDVPSQDVITRDNVALQVDAVLYFRVMDPIDAIIQVEDFLYATSQLAQTTLRSVCGQSELDDLLTERERINLALQQTLDGQTAAWGIKVGAVEVKHLDLPTEMRRAMARQADAERERRAKVIHAEGEYQAAGRLTEAAGLMAGEPTTLQLRFLQTLTDVSTEHNATIVVPVPVDLLEQFIVHGPPPVKGRADERQSQPTKDAAKAIDPSETFAPLSEDTRTLVKYLVKMSVSEGVFAESEKRFIQRAVEGIHEAMSADQFNELIAEASQESLDRILSSIEKKPAAFREKLLYLAILAATADGTVALQERKILAESLPLLGISRDRYEEIAEDVVAESRAPKDDRGHRDTD